MKTNIKFLIVSITVIIFGSAKAMQLTKDEKRIFVESLITKLSYETNMLYNSHLNTADQKVIEIDNQIKSKCALCKFNIERACNFSKKVHLDVKKPLTAQEVEDLIENILAN